MSGDWTPYLDLLLISGYIPQRLEVKSFVDAHSGAVRDELVGCKGPADMVFEMVTATGSNVCRWYGLVWQVIRDAVDGGSECCR